MVRGILFDLDDTLFDHRHAARAALEAVRGCHACFAGFTPADFEDAHSRLLEELHLRVLAGDLALDVARNERFRRLYNLAGVAADETLVRATAAAYRARYLDAWQAIPGGRALLDALADRAKIAIVSNNLLEETQEKIRFCGFEACVEALVVSGSVGVSKPDPRIFRIALERLGCSADQAVMIGDSWQADIMGARAAGIRAIWFNPRGVEAPDPDVDVVQLRAFEPLSTVLDIVFARAGALPCA